MADAVAQEKFHCAACGADARWDPARQALVCPFCGTVSPGKLDPKTGRIIEHDLVEALREIPPERRGWKAEKLSVKCQSCQAISVFDATRVAQRCEFCGSAQLVPYEQLKAPISPESLLPFKITESQVRDTARQWYGSRWFAPSRLKHAAMTDQVRGVYLPYWTFDARAHSDWSADSGYYYWESEAYTDSQGKVQTRQVRKVRWQPSSGSVRHFFDDELVSASRGVNPELLRKIEPFPTQDLSAYKPDFLAGWIVEQYQVDLSAAASRSTEQMNAQMEQLCAQQVPGDTHRNLRVQTDYADRTFKHILVPIWLLTFVYGAENYQVLINGYTGAIAGKYPLSWVKILLTIFGILIAVLLFLFFTQR
jgi:hypothetical protein